ncbi:hypothetical protein [Desulfobulbus alkaliphilus]|uniref:hypothetical protein n=1 Tax=Desulfobulbus alkaliphilus TaxID=869814 RepID=UPI00196505FF|nr:hypothetical protein [Desulfobulbus alkaliphilus]MBM9538046.1 hypothetical protein [Desulfobulbus alkaliphilus]
MSALSVAFISFLLLALQIVWMQALGYAQGHHLAYVVLSIALLGFGAGGSVLTLWSRPASLKRLFAPCLLLCALATALVPQLAHPLLMGLEVDLLHVDHSQWLRLVILGGVMFLPFFLGAASLTIAFSLGAGTIGPLYAANLAGSAVGAVASLGLLHFALPEQVMPWLAWIALLAALPARPGKAVFFLTMLAVGVALALSPPLPRSPYKALSYALQLPGVERQGPLPHPLGRVDIAQSSVLRFAPDLSLYYTGPVPAPPHLFIDGEAAGHLLNPADPAALILAETPRALAFAAGPVHTLLCLAPGGTPFLNLATAQGAQTVAVEPHPRITTLITPLIVADRTRLKQSDPRLFLAQADLPPLDLILFPDRGMFGGPTGLQTLGEDTLFTVEAISSALRMLTPTGRLAFNVWLDEPLRHAPRMVHLIVQSLRATGIEQPEDHVTIIRGWGSLSILADRQPLSLETLEAVIHFAEAKGFDVLWPPGSGERRHGRAGDSLESMLAQLLSGHPENLLRTYPFDIRAPTDDRPFFHQFLRLGTYDADLDFLSISERGPIFLLALLLLLFIAVVLVVFAPLWPLRASLSRAPFTLLYFAGLGAGFMIFEVALIQRFTLLWGSPVTSAALVITALLCGMSVGSWYSRRLPARPVVLMGLALGIATLQVLMPMILTPIITFLLATETVIRIGGGMAVLVLAALPLGLPFPLGIRLLNRDTPGQIPWACGIDSALAVLAAPAAALLALHAGYSSLAIAATLAYLLAALGAFSFIFRPKSNR